MAKPLTNQGSEEGASTLDIIKNGVTIRLHSNTPARRIGEIAAASAPAGVQGLYGAVAIYERVSGHLDWIESVINAGVKVRDQLDNTHSED